ncbi:hypothetical protein Tco_0072715 [Tanacetum coccineum]
MVNLEQIFPPDFFDIMIHLVIYLPDEAIQGGPLRCRWMFPFERYMKKLKNYVRNKAKSEGSIAKGYVAEEALNFCSRYLKDVEARFNHPGRNDDGLPEQPDKFQVFQSVCKPAGRMKETRMTTDVMQVVVWFVLNNSLEVDADILAYREESPDNVETSFPACCSEELFSLACGPTSACTYPACIVNGVKFVVHERDILHTTQSSGVSTPGLDGEMYYGQLEEILELTYIGHRKVVLFRCKWFDTINPKNHTTRNRRSYIDQGIHHILTDREFHKNNQYILATQATQVFYLEDLARQPRGWKVVEHVYHRDVAESDQDVIHGSSSSHVTLSVGLTCLEHTDLSINAQSTEVDAPPVNDDNANANEDNADFINNEDDVVAHVLDDDDVEVSDDDEVNPSTNVEEMACVAPRSHGGDAGGSPPRRPTRPVPAQCQSSMLRLETGNRSLRKAFRENNEQPLKIGFDYEDLGTFHPLGNFSGMLNSLMGETVRPLPLACEWEEIPEAYKAHIYPTLESYFNLAEWYNKQDKVVVDRNVYTVGERVRLGLKLKLRLLWRKNKNMNKADHYAKHTSPDEAKNHPPPPKVWGKRTQDDWNELVDWWPQPDRVSRCLQNAANRAKNTIITHQGKKSFAQGRNEYKVDKGYYEDLIETWRKGHSNKKTGQFKTTENEQRYLDMKTMKDNIKVSLIPFKTDQEILDEIVPSDNRQNRQQPEYVGHGLGRKLSRVMFRQQEQEKELLRKQAEEAQARAYLAALKADAAEQRANVAQQNSEANNAALAERPHYILQTNPHMNDSRSCEQLAQDLARENNNESSGEEEEDEQRTGGDDDYSDDDDYDDVNDVGGVGYSKADGKWVPARRIEDGWYLFDELGSKLYFEYSIKNVPQLSDDKHADYNKKHKREIQRRMWNPGIKRIFKTSP